MAKKNKSDKKSVEIHQFVTIKLKQKRLIEAFLRQKGLIVGKISDG
jgi:hypothetical protein